MISAQWERLDWTQLHQFPFVFGNKDLGDSVQPMRRPENGTQAEADMGRTVLQVEIARGDADCSSIWASDVD